mmetsp:Transcript_9235/g.20833  ORF Transcript_9235/g.20833 Transcript_9235/m.20833 type:complete len:266 (+) Transcript_9235:214-1011(+)
MYEKALSMRYPNSDSSNSKVSVPQRLDNDTSGVLVISTNSSFSSYMSKLFEAKTSLHTRGELHPTKCSVTKKYKCLVSFKSSDDIDRLLTIAGMGETVITHYLSPARTTPRIFKEVPGEDTKEGSWRECHLRISSVGFDRSTSVSVRGSTDANDLANKLRIRSSLNCVAVTQVEVELLTGRTHQIRGQMAGLGFPLVGDELYGEGIVADDAARIALHCCQLSFPVPLIAPLIGCKKNRTRTQWHPSSQIHTFRCEYGAWWNQYIR